MHTAKVFALQAEDANKSPTPNSTPEIQTPNEDRSQPVSLLTTNREKIQVPITDRNRSGSPKSDSIAMMETSRSRKRGGDDTMNNMCTCRPFLDTINSPSMKSIKFMSSLKSPLSQHRKDPTVFHARPLSLGLKAVEMDNRDPRSPMTPASNPYRDSTTMGLTMGQMRSTVNSLLNGARARSEGRNISDTRQRLGKFDDVVDYTPRTQGQLAVKSRISNFNDYEEDEYDDNDDDDNEKEKAKD